MAASLTLGGYEFDPVPVVSIQKTWIRTESGAPIGAIKTATFTGTLLSENISNPDNPMDLRHQMDEEFESCDQCVRMELTCGSGLIIDSYVRIQNIDWGQSPDNWTITIPIGFTVEWDEAQDNISNVSGELPCSACLRSITDNWSFELLETPAQYSVSTCSGPSFVQFEHTVEATAIDCCISGAMTSGWVIAKNWVDSQLGFDSTLFSGAPEFGFDDNNFSICGHTRAGTLNRYAGSYSMTETFTVATPAIDCCFDDYTVNCEENTQSRLTTYSIQGTITGFEARASGDFSTIESTKIEQAMACFNAIEDSLHNRIECFCGTSPSGLCPVNPIPLTKSMGYSPTAGTVTYNYTYDNRPLSLVEGAIYENISISNDNNQEQIIEIPIPGRVAGPILKSCLTQPAKRKSVTIQVIFPYEDCPAATSGCIPARLNSFGLSTTQRAYVENFLCCVEGTMSDADFLARERDNESFSFPDGSYSRNVTWVYQYCTDTLPNDC